MRKLLLISIAAVLFLPPYAWSDSHMAVAKLTNAKGKSVGKVTLEQTPNGILVTADLEGLPKGEHGFHIHETGKCEATTFKSAGGHYAPLNNRHGFRDDKGPHVGDMPNLFAGDDGKVKATVFNARASLKAGDKATLFDKDGSAIVIHANADDYKTDPAGKGGKRIACGVIEKKTK